MSGTGFYWHERCFWHDQGAIGVFSAPGEFLQPQAASESPESKRRLKNILEVSGLIDELYVVKPPAAILEDLLRFHTPRYLEELQAGDAARGGNGGDCAPYMPGSWAAATHSAGLAIAAVDAAAQRADTCPQRHGAAAAALSPGGTRRAGGLPALADPGMRGEWRRGLRG